LTCSELVGQAGGAATAGEAPGVVAGALLGADGADGVAVTVTVVPGAADVPADDEQPATATQMNAAAAMASLAAPEFGERSGPERPALESTALESTALESTGLENAGLENTDMPFTRMAPRTPYSNYDDDAVIPVGATPTHRPGSRWR
jgi:hypothetical protein